MSDKNKKVIKVNFNKEQNELIRRFNDLEDICNSEKQQAVDNPLLFYEKATQEITRLRLILCRIRKTIDKHEYGKFHVKFKSDNSSDFLNFNQNIDYSNGKVILKIKDIIGEL